MTRKFRLLVTSDIHATILPTRYSDGIEESMGLAKIATLFDTLRDENTLCIDNGDLLQGSPLAFYFNQYYSKKVSPVTLAAKKVKYDYLNLGNHDFNFGIEALQRHLKEMQIPCLTNNVTVRGQSLSPLYHIHQFPNGVKIALFGVVTQFIERWEKTETLKEMSVEYAFDAAQKAVQAICEHEEVDAIVGVYHGGFERDLQTGVLTEKDTGENLGYRICEELGIDILLTGHQHRSLAQKCCGVVVAQTAQNGREIACIDFDVDHHQAEVTLLPTQSDPNVEISQMIEPLEREFQQWLDQPLGTSEQPLKVTNLFEARVHKHPVVSFMNQVQLEKTNADFSAVALFNEAEGFNQAITMRDIVSTYVYSNTLCTLEVTGHTLKKFLERCAEYFVKSNGHGEIEVNPQYLYPKPRHFDYDMVDGLEYTIEVSNPIGKRITSMTRNEVAIDLDKTYTLAISSYRASGGGNFEMLQDATILKEESEEMVEIIADYVLRNPVLIVNHKSNITVK